MNLKDYIKPDAEGWTLLHEATRYGHLDQVLAELGAYEQKLSPEHFLIKDNLDRTPLHWAVAEGHLDQVVATLQASREKLSLEHFLIKDNLDRTPLHWAAWYNHIDQVMTALEPSGEKPSLRHFLIKDNLGWSPISGAAASGHLSKIFVPAYWKGRVGEMMQLWERVPEKHKKGFAFDALRDDAILRSQPPAQRIDPQTFLDAARVGSSLSSEAPQKIAGL